METKQETKRETKRAIVTAARALAFCALALPVIPGMPVWASDPAGSEDLTGATATAQSDLDKSLLELSALREKIAAEKLPLTRELSRLEVELSEARRELADASRSRDEKTLETDNLQGALKLRQEEMTYITNLFDEYARGFETMLHSSEIPHLTEVMDTARQASGNKDLTLSQKLGRQTSLLKASAARLIDLIGGTRYEGQAVDPQGSIVQGRFAMIGPVVLFAAAAGMPSGLAMAQTGSSQTAVRPLDEAATPGVVQVVSQGEGLLPLDPTRGGALQELINRGSLIATFKHGGPIMWPLLGVSILALTVIVERMIFLAGHRRRRNRHLVEDLLARVEEGDVEGAIAVGESSQDYVARALTYAMKHREKSLSNALSRSAGAELVRFNRGISILDTCVTMAPLLGLLGTVTGMMGSFGAMGGSELGAPAQITGGIAEALIATCFGLGIAVTALVPMNYLHNRSDEARHEMEDATTHLELLMKPIQDAEARRRERFIMERYELAPRLARSESEALVSA